MSAVIETTRSKVLPHDATTKPVKRSCPVNEQASLAGQLSLAANPLMQSTSIRPVL